MTEGFNHIASDQELETAAIAGAAAVERLITERNNFRTELAASKAAQEELRRRFGLLHRYIELSRKVVCELHQFDSLMRDDIGERAEVINDEAESTGPNRQFDSDGLPQPQKAPHNGNGTAHARGPLPLEA